MSVTQHCESIHRRAMGFSLVEVLVALFILAVGLLGMTGLQNEALKYNHAAFLESQAQFLLADMVERIRANPAGGAYAIAFTEAAPTPPVNCTANTCASAQMALWDIQEWRAMVEDSAYLPGGESEISHDPFNRLYTVSIRFEWSQLAEDPAGGSRTLSITTRI